MPKLAFVPKAFVQRAQHSFSQCNKCAKFVAASLSPKASRSIRGHPQLYKKKNNLVNTSVVIRTLTCCKIRVLHCTVFFICPVLLVFRDVPLWVRFLHLLCRLHIKP